VERETEEPVANEEVASEEADGAKPPSSGDSGSGVSGGGGKGGGENKDSGKRRGLLNIWRGGGECSICCKSYVLEENTIEFLSVLIKSEQP
jgi:hypothetical protein